MRIRRSAVLSAALLCCVAGAHGQGVAYPSKPIRFVVPQTPSGQIDTVARTVAQHLGERLGQPLIVKNLAGANGVIELE